MPKVLCRFFIGLVLIGGQPPATTPKAETATLVEIQLVPPCYGLDCPPPPFPVAIDAYLCFQIKDTYYVGTYRPWGFPWAPPGKRLLALRGQAVEVVVTNKRIKMTAPFNLDLKRIHDYRLFGLRSCNQA